MDNAICDYSVIPMLQTFSGARAVGHIDEGVYAAVQPPHF
jgi:hypothetical protein